MDTLSEFHGAPPWMNFPQCYHLTIKSTINPSKNYISVLARYVHFEGIEGARDVVLASER
jgi:hypothetical protein